MLLGTKRTTKMLHGCNFIERWILRRAIRKMIRQGPQWESNVTEVYAMIYDRCREVFYEDNYPTRVYYLRECFEKATQYVP